MQTLRMEAQNYNHEKWYEKGLREKDLSPQSQLLLNARQYQKARYNDDLPLAAEVDRDLLMTEHFPEESPRAPGSRMPHAGSFSQHQSNAHSLKPYQMPKMHS